MAISTPKEMYRHACANGYALGAFNISSLESMLAVMDAAETTASPVIVQVSMGARSYVRHLQAFINTIKRFSAEYSAPMFVQHDHCSTLNSCEEAMDAGVQALMFDGSHLPYEDNVRLTKQVVERAHTRGVWVEAELGRLPGVEDMVFAESTIYTDPKLANRFIRETGCDCLAVAVGTSHGGVQASDYLPLDVGLVDAISRETSGFPLVLHGGASLPPELIDACNSQGAQVEYLRNCSEPSVAKAVKAGIRKVNMDVDNFIVFTTAVRKYLAENPSIYDPRKYLAPARDAFMDEVAHKMRNVLFSAGQAKAETNEKGEY